MNSYIVSIRPEWVKKIVNREKTFEVRKSAPLTPAIPLQFGLAVALKKIHEKLRRKKK